MIVLRGTMAFPTKNELFGNEDILFDIVKVGQEHCHSHKGPVERVRPHYALHFVLFGSGNLIMNDGSSYKLSRGDAFLLYKDEFYSYYPNSKDPWSYVWVELQGEGLERLFSLCGFDKRNVQKHIENFNEYVELMKEMLNAFDTSKAQQLRCSAYFLLLIGKFIEEEERKRESPALSKKRKMLRDILIYINNNFNLNLTNEQIALESGISVRGLTQLFSEILGISPVKYLNSYRIAIACERFQTTDMNVTEAARWAGFEDEKYFSRVFKKEKGMSPKDYRKSATDEDAFSWLKEKGIFL